MYPTTSPSTSVIAMSGRGVTSPSMLYAVRPSRTATLNEVQPMYASFPTRFARFSPTRCQNSITPSAPAFSIRSSIRDTSATSSIVGQLLRPSHERLQHLPHLGGPLPPRLLRGRLSGDLPDLRRHEVEEPVPVPLRHVRGGRPDLVERHREDLVERAHPDRRLEPLLDEPEDLHVPLVPAGLLELLHEQRAGELLQLRRDVPRVPGEVPLRHPALVQEVLHHDGGVLHAVHDALHVRHLEGLRRQEHEERLVADARDDDRAHVVLLDAQHHVLPAELVADVVEVALDEVQEVVLLRVQVPRHVAREDPAVHPEEQHDVERVLLAAPAQLRLEHVLQEADGLRLHRLVDLAGEGRHRRPHRLSPYESNTIWRASSGEYS